MVTGVSMQTRSLQRRPVRVLVLLGLLCVLASVLDAVCYANVVVYYSDGSTQSCGTFCTFPGGWLCR